jgi:hypothetical protein
MRVKVELSLDIEPNDAYVKEMAGKAITSEVARLEAIKVELDALYFELRHRPAAEAEIRIAADAAQLIDVPGLPRFPFGALIAFRMTEADKQREARLIGEWNTIASAARQHRNDRRQAKVNAREVAAVRAAACPICLATHPGTC